MILSASIRRRTAVSVAAALCGVLLYEATLLDSRYAARRARFRAMTAPPAPGETLRFQATAYCKGTITKSGVLVRSGIAAGDPQLLPVGSVIAIGAAGPYNGIYTILDTGPAIQGRIIDLYMWSCYEALEFGRRDIDIRILRLGWKPIDSSPHRVDELFREREDIWRPPLLPSRPLTPVAPVLPR